LCYEGHIQGSDKSKEAHVRSHSIADLLFSDLIEEDLLAKSSLPASDFNINPQSCLTSTLRLQQWPDVSEPTFATLLNENMTDITADCTKAQPLIDTARGAHLEADAVLPPSSPMELFYRAAKPGVPCLTQEILHSLSEG
jgi:hypothetical protein